MTAYEIARKVQSTSCRMADSYMADIVKAEKEDDMIMVNTWTELWQASIDSAYVLGLMIDAMPVELAEREV